MSATAHMMLTPIKVPGKRKRGRTNLSSSDGRSVSSSNLDRCLCLIFQQTRPRLVGRPRKNVSDKPQLAKDSKASGAPAKLQLLKNIKSKGKMAALERLPTELLEKVFLFALNFELPRSSPIIAAKLSSQHMYTSAIINLFGPTWEKQYQLVRKNKWLDVYEDVGLMIPGNHNMQVGLIA
jgi:hypothetical protein